MGEVHAAVGLAASSRLLARAVFPGQRVVHLHERAMEAAGLHRDNDGDQNSKGQHRQQ